MKYCPKCGSNYVYVGASKIECGEYSQCENYSDKQAEEVQSLFEKTEFIDEENIEEEDTDPLLPLPLFYNDDDQGI